MLPCSGRVGQVGDDELHDTGTKNTVDVVGKIEENDLFIEPYEEAFKLSRRRGRRGRLWRIHRVRRLRGREG